MLPSSTQDELSKKKLLAPPADKRARTIPEFCARWGISVPLFYKKPHEMPRTFYVGRRRLVSNEAEEDWRIAREREQAAREAAILS